MKPIDLANEILRGQLIAWLCVADGNGVWTDKESRANDMPPLTLERALDRVREMLTQE